MSNGTTNPAETPQTPTAVLTDQPDHEDKLGFSLYAGAIRDIILTASERTPITIGIFGSWGSGKTSLMRMIERGLLDASLDAEKQYQTIWFNAWLYNKEQALWRALIMQVLNGIRELRAGDAAVRERLDELAEQLYRTSSPSELGTLSIAASDLMSDTGTGAAQISLRVQHALDFLEKIAAAREQGDLAAVQTLRKEVRRAMAKLEQERIESLEQFQRHFRQLVQENVLTTGLLVVFVDDLDRCLPEKAVEVLEALKLFLDVEGCIFILGIDQQVVERGIKLRYRELTEANHSDDVQLEELIDGRKYLEKIIQIPFALPPISSDAMGQYINAIAPGLPHPECGQVFAATLEPNPRRVKRALNIFWLLWNLARTRTDQTIAITAVRLAKLVVLQQRFPELYDQLRSQPELLIGWENQARDLPATPDTPIFDLPEGLSADDERALRKLLTMHPLDGEANVGNNFSGLSSDEIFAYVYLTSTVKKSEETAATAPPTPPISKDVSATLEPSDAEGRVVTLNTGQAERRSYAEATFLGDLDALGRSLPDLATGEDMLEELARSGSGFYQQIFPDPVQRTVFAAELAEPATISIPGRAGDFQVPWEIVYDAEIEGFNYVQQYAQKAPVSFDQRGATIDGFWGFKHIIERRIPRPSPVDARMVPTAGRPIVSVTISAEMPGADDVTRFFSELESQGTISLRRADEPETLRKMLMDASVNLYVIHAYGGKDTSESWFALSGERSSQVTRRTLVDVLGRAFDPAGLRGIVDELQIDAEAIYGTTLREQATNLVSYLYRRGRLDELTSYVSRERPDIDLSVNRVRLTRQEVESWRIQRSGNALLYANVNTGIGRGNDWPGWLDLLANMGISSIVAPMAGVSPEWSTPFMQRFMQVFLSGKPAGEALREARRALFETTRNPLGLLLAHFGPSDQHLAPA